MILLILFIFEPCTSSQPHKVVYLPFFARLAFIRIKNIAYCFVFIAFFCDIKILQEERTVSQDLSLSTMAFTTAKSKILSLIVAIRCVLDHIRVLRRAFVITFSVDTVLNSLPSLLHRYFLKHPYPESICVNPQVIRPCRLIVSTVRRPQSDFVSYCSYLSNILYQRWNQ